jgi:hypothetical protein
MRTLVRGWLEVAALTIVASNCAGSTSNSQGADGSVDAAPAQDGVADLDVATDQQGHEATSPEDAVAVDATVAVDASAGDASVADDSSTPSDASVADGGSCADRFVAAVDKRCASVGDCTTANHSDCCGTVVVGIRAGTQATFTAAEQAFQTCVPGCGLRGCFHADLAEDQQSTMSLDGAARAIVVRCDNGRCMTHVQ